MKVCPKCNSQLTDDAMFCPNCGMNMAQPAQPVQAVANPYDHTAEFSKEEVSEFKLYALLCYLLGFFGVIIALIARISKNSKYLDFHIKQVLKISVLQILTGLITALLSWTCIALFAGMAAICVLWVVIIISFFSTCSNKSVETPIVRSFGFLN